MREKGCGASHNPSLLGVGKLEYGVLDALLRICSVEDERVIVRPRVGEDAAVIDFGER